MTWRMSPPRVSNSRSLRWGLRIYISANSWAMLMLLVLGPHFENLCSRKWRRKKCSFCRPQTYEFPQFLLLSSLHLSVPFLFLSFLLCPTSIFRAHHLGWADQMVTGCQRPQACGVIGYGEVQVGQPDTRGEIPCSMQGARSLPTPRVAFLLGSGGPRAAGC